MAPFTTMEQAVFLTLSSTTPQQIDITSSIQITSTNNNQFVDEFLYDTNTSKNENGISGITPGHYLGRQSIADTVTNPPLKC